MWVSLGKTQWGRDGTSWRMKLVSSFPKAEEAARSPAHTCQAGGNPIHHPIHRPGQAPPGQLQAVRGLALLPAPAFPPHCQLHPIYTPTCSADSPCRSGFVHRTLCGRLCSCPSPGSLPSFQEPEIFWMNSCSECPNLPRAASGEGGKGQIQPGGHKHREQD